MGIPAVALRIYVLVEMFHVLHFSDIVLLKGALAVHLLIHIFSITISSIAVISVV